MIRENVVEAIAKLKQKPGGDIGITGSATLVQSLMEANLIDEYQLQFYPLVLASGKCLFKDGVDKLALKHVEEKTFRSGAIALTYQPDRKA